MSDVAPMILGVIVLFGAVGGYSRPSHRGWSRCATCGLYRYRCSGWLWRGARCTECGNPLRGPR